MAICLLDVGFIKGSFIAGKLIIEIVVVLSLLLEVIVVILSRLEKSVIKVESIDERARFWMYSLIISLIC